MVPVRIPVPQPAIRTNPSRPTPRPTDAPPTTSSITAPGTTTTTALVRPLIARKPLVTLVGPAATTDELAPEFTWEPIDGAMRYQLVVIDDDGPIWAWTGSTTAVRLGGFDTERPTGFPGPDVTDTTRWSVAALDKTGTIIAISDARALAPAS